MDKSSVVVPGGSAEPPDGVSHSSGSEQEQAPALIADGVSFNYGDRQALSNLSIAIRRAEIFAFLGPNGGGKTTLFKLLSTLVPLQKGSIQVLGSDLRGDTVAVRRRMGVVFQHPSLDGMLTVRENLAHHGHLYGMRGGALKARCAEVMAQLGIEDRASELVQTLSGGLQRRVELAKALLHRPELLLLDEPSTGLDPVARREFGNRLAELRETQKVTVILTTHHMDEAERCDRIGILHQGRLVEAAPPAELRAQVGGDVVVIRGPDSKSLSRQLLDRMGLDNAIVDGTVRVEHPQGHELVRDVVAAFGDEIESVTFGKPTLEDVFVHLTGHQFQTDGAAAEQ